MTSLQWIKSKFKKTSGMTLPAKPKKTSMWRPAWPWSKPYIPTMEDILLAAKMRTFQRQHLLAKAPKVGMTMDSADTMNSGNIKNLYNLSSFGIPAAQVSWFASWGFIGYQMCALLSQHWLVNKACRMAPQDAEAVGFRVGSIGKKVTPEVINKIKALDKKYDLSEMLIRHVYFGRVYGISIMKFEVETENPREYYANPFNINAVKPGSYKGMVKIEPIWVTPELSGNAAAYPQLLHFYEPTWWNINGQKIHRSHLIIMRNGEVPDILKPTYYFGGMPLTQLIANRVYSAERTADEAPLLAMTKRSTVLHTDLNKAVLNPDAFNQKMAQWTQWWDNFGAKIVGDKDVIEQFDTALAGFDETIMTGYQLVSAVAETPATKLLGTSPKGFGASGEYEEKSYHEFLRGLQKRKMSPVIERHHQLLIRSELPENEWFEPSHVWNALDSTTSKGIAENNKIKAETATSHIAAGVISPDEERARLKNDEDSGYSGLLIEESAEPIESKEDDELIRQEYLNTKG